MSRPPGALTLAEDDRRVLAPWAADCAERILSLFEECAPGDIRPRAAIEGLRAFAHGELRIGPMRALAVAAHAAARDVGDPAATAAARAAGHAAATAHMASHARGVPAYAAIARGHATAGDPTQAMSEIEWAAEHASAEVREVLRRLPDPIRGGGQLGALIRDLHARTVGSDAR
jgi:Imm-5 like putative immunity protein